MPSLTLWKEKSILSPLTNLMQNQTGGTQGITLDPGSSRHITVKKTKKQNKTVKHMRAQL